MDVLIVDADRLASMHDVCNEGSSSVESTYDLAAAAAAAAVDLVCGMHVVELLFGAAAAAAAAAAVDPVCGMHVAELMSAPAAAAASAVCVVRTVADLIRDGRGGCGAGVVCCTHCSRSHM